MRGRLVEQQHRGGGAEHAGQTQPLPLTERQANPVAADDGIRTVGQLCQHGVETRVGTGSSGSGRSPKRARFSAIVPGISTGRWASQAS